MLVDHQKILYVYSQTVLLLCNQPLNTIQIVKKEIASGHHRMPFSEHCPGCLLPVLSIAACVFVLISEAGGERYREYTHAPCIIYLCTAFLHLQSAPAVLCHCDCTG